MRVAICTNYYSPQYGMGTHYMCRGLGDLGIDVTLFASSKYGKKRPPRELGANELVGAFRRPFKLVKVDTITSVANVPIMFGLNGDLRKEQAFDIIQTEDAYQPYSFTAAKFSESAGIPLLLRHDLDQAPAVEPYHTGFKIVERVISKKIVSIAKRATTPTSAARNYLRGLRPSLPVDVIPLGVDTNEFSPKTEDGHQNLEILTVARLVREKGLIELLTAVALLSKVAPEVRLTLIGRGPMKDGVRNLAKKLGIFDIIRFVDFVRHDKLNEYYNSCDLFVLPSYAETPGLSVMEAMACAKPVVATDIPGINDSVDNGINGVLVPPKNIERLYDAILTLRNHPDDARNLGLRAREKAVSALSWDLACRKLVRVYDDMLPG